MLLFSQHKCFSSEWTLLGHVSDEKLFLQFVNFEEKKNVIDEKSRPCRNECQIVLKLGHINLHFPVEDHSLSIQYNFENVKRVKKT